jgi:predicted transcriptional regulator
MSIATKQRKASVSESAANTDIVGKSAPLSLKLTPISRQRLHALAEFQRRPAHAIAREAIEAYLVAEEEQIRHNQEAEAAWKHYQDTGLHVTGEAAIAWIESWGTSNELPKPVCHV